MSHLKVTGEVTALKKEQNDRDLGMAGLTGTRDSNILRMLSISFLLH